MKVTEHRKHRVKEKSSKKLSSELFALTTGVCLYWKNIRATVIEMHAPKREKETNSIPNNSVNVRNSTAFISHLFLSSLDLNSGGHLSHFTASENINIFMMYSTYIFK